MVYEVRIYLCFLFSSILALVYTHYQGLQVAAQCNASLLYCVSAKEMAQTVIRRTSYGTDGHVEK